MKAPGLTATSGVTLAGQSYGSVTTTGRLVGRRQTVSLEPVRGRYLVSLPPASAALLTVRELLETKQLAAREMLERGEGIANVAGPMRWIDQPGARPGAPAFRAFVEHWTVDGFVAYVAGLAEAADRALTVAPSAQRDEAAIVFRLVAEYERGFWQMAFDG